MELIRWVIHIILTPSHLSYIPPFPPQVTKATGKFLLWSHFGGWQFNDWNTWRMRDGMMCRTRDDCSWMDRNLLCQDYDLDLSISRAWFGGDFASIRGKCQCRDGMEWDNYELQCEADSWSGVMIFLFCLIALVGLAVLGAVCCCFLRGR